MKASRCLTLALLFSGFGALGLVGQSSTHRQLDRSHADIGGVNPDWAPFFHGVASGDPLSDRVIIWTRVTPENMDGATVEVRWVVASDPELSMVVKSGTFIAEEAHDYTIKVDVTGLQSGTTYYYGFSALGKNSLTGRTKTTPIAEQASHLKFGVVSCSNYQAGYFNGYRRLAARNDIDAVIHLGDYIYEYQDGGYGDTSLIGKRPIKPGHELITLEDYRIRYSTYRLDSSLARVHQQHPFITVWDDHESANDSYEGGAQNHSEGAEGAWEVRKADAKKAYFEWMPIRDNASGQVFRHIGYGNIMDLFLLDTRLEGREKQIENVQDSSLQDTNRTILGSEQREWLFEQLKNSDAKWKVIGQQVIFSELNVGWAAIADPSFSFFGLESLFLDIWDGYPAERQKVIDLITADSINNVVILTGDFHTTLAFDVSSTPVNLVFQPFPGFGNIPFYNPSTSYNRISGKGAVAVEFATPSITSANFDENSTDSLALVLQNQINKDIVALGILNLGNPNPHMKYADLIQHGYFVLDIKPDGVQADWFFTPILKINEEETAGESWYTKLDSNHLQRAMNPAGAKSFQDIPAPYNPPLATSLQEEKDPSGFTIFAVYPNPSQVLNTLHYSLKQPAAVLIELYNNEGKKIQKVLTEEHHTAGLFSIQTSVKELPNGIYFYKIQVGNRTYTAKLVVKR